MDAIQSNSKGENTDYDAVMKGIHWVTLLFIIALFAIGWSFSIIPRGEFKTSLYNWHKTIGILVVAFTVFRLYWRFTHVIPTLPDSLPEWEKKAARLSHGLLYMFLLVQPSTGLFLAFTTASPMLVFDIIPLPINFEVEKSVRSVFSTLHIYSSRLLLLVIVIHTLAAFRHYFILKNTIMQRMLPRLKK